MRLAVQLWLVACALSAGCGVRREAPPLAASRPAEPAASAQAPAPLAPPSDAETSASGLVSSRLAPGRDEAHPQPQDRVRVSFSAYNARGEVSDGSALRGGPEVFALTGVIAGWREALSAMRPGERRRIWVPDHLTYPGRPGPPRPSAVFDLELLEVLPGMPPLAAPADVAGAPADAIRTRSGLQYKLLSTSGGHERPRAWDRVALLYTGWTADGAEVESARERPQLFELPQALPGWREALPLLAVGDKARLWLPPALAYQGRAGLPQGAVVFDVELTAVQRRPEPPRAPDDVAAVPPDAKRTGSGLAYRVLRRGHGKTRAQPDGRVSVHYSAWTASGSLFDSSRVRGAPTTLPVARLIPGWAEGLQLMAAGDALRLWIPEQLAYVGGVGGPPGMLVYDVELLEVMR